MTKFLQLIGMVFVASALTAEDAKVEVATEENKAAAMAAEPAKVTDAAMPAVHHEHVNRKAADALSARLNAMTAPYAAPLTAIPEMPACCAEKKAKNHGHHAVMHHKASVKHDEKKEHHKDVKHDDKKEHHDADKKADHKDTDKK
jgi:hypothetical protein